MNMTFEMIHGDQRKMIRKGECLGVSDAHQKRSRKARAGGHSDGIEIGERNVRFVKRGTNHGNDGAKMLAAGQLRHHAAVTRVRRDLRSDHGGDRARATLYDRRGSFVAGAFNAENEAGAGHILSVLGGVGRIRSLVVRQFESVVKGNDLRGR